MTRNLMISIFALFFSFPIVAQDLPSILTEQEIQDIACGDSEQVKDHMKVMGRLIVELTGSVDMVLDPEVSEAKKSQVLLLSQKLRAHLSAVMLQNPPKLYKIDPENVLRAKLIFQDYVNKVIAKTLDLDFQLIEKPETPEEQKQQMIQVASLILEIDKIIKSAHFNYRDK